MYNNLKRTSLNVAAYGHIVWNLILQLSGIFIIFTIIYNCHIKTFGNNYHNYFERENLRKWAFRYKNIYNQSFLVAYLASIFKINHLKNNKCFQNS